MRNRILNNLVWLYSVFMTGVMSGMLYAVGHIVAR